MDHDRIDGTDIRRRDGVLFQAFRDLSDERPVFGLFCTVELCDTLDGIHLERVPVLDALEPTVAGVSIVLDSHAPTSHTVPQIVVVGGRCGRDRIMWRPTHTRNPLMVARADTLIVQTTKHGYMVPPAEGEQTGSDGYRVIDCDVHVMRPETVQDHKAEYMEMPYRVQVDPGKAGLGGGYPSAGQIVAVPEMEVDYLQTEAEDGIAEIDRDLREPHLDANGIDVPILNMGPLGMNAILETDRRRQEMRATNNTLLDRFLDEHDDLVGLASIAPSLPTETAEEIDRVGSERGVVGLYTDVSHLDPPFGDRKYDPVFEAAADNDLPIVLHGAHDCIHTPNLTRGVESHLEEYTAGHVISHTLNLASMVYQGVPVRHPDVEFVSLSGGLSMAAGLIGRMNRDYEARSFDAPLLEKQPGEYIRDAFSFGTTPLPLYADSDHLNSIIQIVGPDSIVYASNYPLYNSESPEQIVAACEGLGEDAVEAIMGGNAEAIFGLD